MIFNATRVRAVLDKLGQSPPSWPDLDGVLVMAFASRAGSTWLSQEIDRRYDVGRMEESLNPRGAVTPPPPGGWWSLKAGVPGFIVGQHLGFFRAYTDRTAYLRLLRRDVVAQAVSIVRAQQAGRWHSFQPRPKGPHPLSYEPEQIARQVKFIVRAAAELDEFIRSTGRPVQTVVYEDCVASLTALTRACDALALPPRPEPLSPWQVSEPLADQVNIRWSARFRRDLTAPTAALIDAYAARF